MRVLTHHWFWAQSMSYLSWNLDLVEACSHFTGKFCFDRHDVCAGEGPFYSCLLVLCGFPNVPGWLLADFSPFFWFPAPSIMETASSQDCPTGSGTSGTPRERMSSSDGSKGSDSQGIPGEKLTEVRAELNRILQQQHQRHTRGRNGSAPVSPVGRSV